MKLIVPTDVSHSQIEAVFARADAIANGSALTLATAEVLLALFNHQFPLPVQPETVLNEAGISYRKLATAEQINSVSDGIVLFSHPEAGAASNYADQTSAAFLNAGDGTNENPVRALMDAHAIRSLRGELKNLRVAILGNLKYSPEAHSLARLLGMYQARISFVTPAALSMPYDLTDEVRLSAYEVEETNDLITTLRKTDALYLANIDSTRVDKRVYDKLKTFYSLNGETFVEAKDGLVVLGEWDGAEAILAPTREVVERSARAVFLALVEAASR
jgi:hypothetical protein